MAEKHWIYVLGDQALKRQADDWQAKMATWQESYEVIKARKDETPSGKLTKVGNEDVLYVYAHMLVDHGHQPLNQVGDTEIGPAALATLLENEGLNKMHKKIKVFACHSGEGGSVSFAGALYTAMVSSYPNIQVCGYTGEVNPAGFGKQKTAGRASGESLATIKQTEWETKGLRAKSKRVCFPSSP